MFSTLAHVHAQYYCHVFHDDDTPGAVKARQEEQGKILLHQLVRNGAVMGHFCKKGIVTQYDSRSVLDAGDIYLLYKTSNYQSLTYIH